MRILIAALWFGFSAAFTAWVMQHTQRSWPVPSGEFGLDYWHGDRSFVNRLPSMFLLIYAVASGVTGAIAFGTADRTTLQKIYSAIGSGIFVLTFPLLIFPCIEALLWIWNPFVALFLFVRCLTFILVESGIIAAPVGAIAGAVAWASTNRNGNTGKSRQ
jgi:hypothetical protein